MHDITTVSHLNQTRIQSGFAKFMSNVYRYMTGGLVLSGLSAWACARQPIISFLYKINEQGMVQPTLLMWLIIFAPFVMLFFLNGAARNTNPTKAQVMFWIFAALMGASLCNIFLIMSMDVIFQALLITAAMFGALSLYGHSTKRDLSVIGRFCMMAVIGIVIAGIINIFTKSPAFAFGINVLCVLVFAGLTAYDTQKLKSIYASIDYENPNAVSAYSVVGALAWYLDFINLFIG